MKNKNQRIIPPQLSHVLDDTPPLPPWLSQLLTHHLPKSSLPMSNRQHWVGFQTFHALSGTPWLLPKPPRFFSCPFGNQKDMPCQTPGFLTLGPCAGWDVRLETVGSDQLRDGTSIAIMSEFGRGWRPVGVTTLPSLGCSDCLWDSVRSCRVR